MRKHQHQQLDYSVNACPERQLVSVLIKEEDIQAGMRVVAQTGDTAWRQIRTVRSRNVKYM